MDTGRHGEEEDRFSHGKETSVTSQAHLSHHSPGTFVGNNRVALAAPRNPSDHMSLHSHGGPVDSTSRSNASASMPSNSTLFRPYAVTDAATGTGSADANSWGFNILPSSFPTLPTLSAPQFLRTENIPNISDYLPTLPNLPLPANFPSMPSLPTSLPRMPSMPSFPMPNLPSLPNLMSYKQTKSWADLKSAVRSAHSRLYEVSNRVPFALNFAPIDTLDENGCRVEGVRIYFLSPSSASPETILHYCDAYDLNDAQVTSSEESDLSSDSASMKGPAGHRSKGYDWKPLIDSTSLKRCKDSDKEVNLEVRLQLERKRIMLTGITSYEFHQKSKRFVFASGQHLFYFDDTGVPPYCPIQIESRVKSSKINPTICPWNSDLVAFVADGAIYVVNISSKEEVRLTTPSSDSSIKAGLPSYVIQEEFRRYIGLWWRPNVQIASTASPTELESDGLIEYSILYEQVDQSMVEIVRIPSYDGSSEEYRFPRPGETNAVSTLHLASFKVDPKSNNIVENATNQLADIKTLCPDYEYLVRVGWFNYDAYWVQVLNRKQTQLELCMFSVSNAFPDQIMYQEVSSKYWLNVGDVLVFLPHAGFNQDDQLSVGSVIKFLWSSEQTGFRHLYTISVRLEETHTEHTAGDSAKDATSQDSSQDAPMEVGSDFRSTLIEKVQLTSGNWEVNDRDVWVDNVNQLVYFIALKEIPIERHLYVASLNPNDRLHNPMKRLTDSGYSHSLIAFDSNFTYFAGIQSNISIPPFGYLHKIVTSESKDHPGHGSPKRKITAERHEVQARVEQLPEFRKLALVADNPFLASLGTQPISTSGGSISSINDQMDLLPGLPKPELFTYKLKDSGDLIYGVIFKPEFMENGEKYPCVLDIYGGPEVQVVSNSFKSIRHVKRHLLASEGYVVCAFDCRGSSNRGREFEGHIYKRLGQVEIEDQVEVLQWLAESTGYIDMKRIAVHGWSYGGYLSLMALAKRPDIFKLSIAGAPVTKWTLYDSGYTERYMDTPENNPTGYHKGSILSYIESFPDEENRLLVIHGLADENVHFIHSAELINALIRAGKPYQLQVYPSERHSLRNSPCCDHYESYLLSYLQQHL